MNESPDSPGSAGGASSTNRVPATEEEENLLWSVGSGVAVGAAVLAIPSIGHFLVAIPRSFIAGNPLFRALGFGISPGGAISIAVLAGLLLGFVRGEDALKPVGGLVLGLFATAVVLNVFAMILLILEPFYDSIGTFFVDNVVLDPVLYGLAGAAGGGVGYLLER